MTRPNPEKQAEQPFLSVTDAEIVHGPDVIADKVADALADADRFDLPKVKPPLSKALDEAERAGGANAREKPETHDALAGKPSEIDEEAGSADLLKPGAELPS